MLLCTSFNLSLPSFLSEPSRDRLHCLNAIDIDIVGMTQGPLVLCGLTICYIEFVTSVHIQAAASCRYIRFLLPSPSYIFFRLPLDYFPFCPALPHLFSAFCYHALCTIQCENSGLSHPQSSISLEFIFHFIPFIFPSSFLISRLPLHLLYPPLPPLQLSHFILSCLTQQQTLPFPSCLIKNKVEQIKDILIFYAITYLILRMENE